MFCLLLAFDRLGWFFLLSLSNAPLQPPTPTSLPTHTYCATHHPSPSLPHKLSSCACFPFLPPTVMPHTLLKAWPHRKTRQVSPTYLLPGSSYIVCIVRDSYHDALLTRHLTVFFAFQQHFGSFGTGHFTSYQIKRHSHSFNRQFDKNKDRTGVVVVKKRRRKRKGQEQLAPIPSFPLHCNIVPIGKPLVAASPHLSSPLCLLYPILSALSSGL